MNITVVYNDDKQIEKVRDLESLTFLDLNTKKGRKEGIALKRYWGARADPFAVIYEDDKPVKVLYSEADNVCDAIWDYINQK